MCRHTPFELVCLFGTKRRACHQSPAAICGTDTNQFVPLAAIVMKPHHVHESTIHRSAQQSRISIPLCRKRKKFKAFQALCPANARSLCIIEWKAVKHRQQGDAKCRRVAAQFGQSELRFGSFLRFVLAGHPKKCDCTEQHSEGLPHHFLLGHGLHKKRGQAHSTCPRFYQLIKK